MQLADLPILARDGSVLVEGELGVYDERGAAVVRSTPGCLIGVAIRSRPFGSTKLLLFGKTQRGADGFHGAARPLLAVDFEEAVPDLFTLLSRMYDGDGRLRIASDAFRVTSANFAAPKTGGQDSGDIYLAGRELNLRLVAETRGWRIRFEGPLGPTDVGNQTLLFGAGTLAGDFLIPDVYCLLGGSPRHISYPAWGRETAGTWAPAGPGLGSVAVDTSGRPFCPGTIDWRQTPGGFHPHKGPFVLLQLGEHEFAARPARNLKRLANGFADCEDHNGGPLMTIFTGHADWSRMLEQSDSAEIDLSGAGLGHIDGDTGRDAYEYGSKRQAILNLRLTLKRSRDGLLVEGRGGLAPLARSEGTPSLGPDLRFSLQIPRAWILARGLPLPRFWDDRRKEHPSADTW